MRIRVNTTRLMFTRSNLQALIDEAKSRIIMPSVDSIFPVGSLFIIATAPSDGGDPNVLFPGTTWKRLTDCLIWAAGDSDIVDDTLRGRNSLTNNDIPYHTHASGGNTGGVIASDNDGSTLYPTGGGTAGIFTCSKNSSGSWSNSGIVTNRSSAGSGSYGWSGTPYQTSEYTLNIQHKHNVKDTLGNLFLNGIQQSSLITSTSIKNIHINRYCWERTA